VTETQYEGNYALQKPYFPKLVTEEEHDPFKDFLQQLHTQYLPLNQGKIYASEPDLGEISPDWFGISVATVEGQVYSVGNWDLPFLIQSISKVFAYGLALEDRGRDEVLSKVDVEPTGDAYDSIIKVELNSKRPYNPMVNTGAIATSNLIYGKSPAHKLNRILEMYQRYVGHPVFVDTPTLVSEQDNGDRNWAIAYLLRHFNLMSGEISKTLHLYLQQCSVILNCRDLAVMGATLANNGVNPITGVSAIAPIYVKDLLSVMYTCGMYDFAGEWVYNVGFPAKSGVSGGIIGVVPGQMGIAIYSPPLDSRGNSIRGIKVCEELSQEFDLHLFKP
jgi:glutaminase